MKTPPWVIFFLGVPILCMILALFAAWCFWRAMNIWKARALGLEAQNAHLRVSLDKSIANCDAAQRIINRQSERGSAAVICLTVLAAIFLIGTFVMCALSAKFGIKTSTEQAASTEVSLGTGVMFQGTNVVLTNATRQVYHATEGELVKATKYSTTTGPDFYVTTIRGHDYISAKLNSGISILHAAHCPCHTNWLANLDLGTKAIFP